MKYRLLLIVLVALNLRPAVTAVGPLLTEIQRDLGLSDTAAGALTTLPVACFGAFGLLAPFLRRRPPAQVLLVLSMAVLAVALLIRVIPLTAALFAGSLLAGIAISVGNIAVPAVIKRDHPERVTTVTAVYSTAITVGAAGSSGFAVPAEHLLDTGWRLPLALLAIPAVIAGLAWLPTALHAARDRGAQAAPRGHGALWRDRLAWHVTGFMGLQSMLAYIVLGWLPTIGQDRGMTKESAGYLLALSALFQAVGSLTVPVIERRLRDQRPLVLLTAGLTLVGYAGCAFAPIGSVWGWAVVLGLGQGIGFATALAFIGLRAPDAEVAGQLSGMAQGVGYLIAALGPLAAGVLHELTGGWTVPSLVFLVLVVLQVLPGLPAGRARTVLSDPA